MSLNASLFLAGFMGAAGVALAAAAAHAKPSTGLESAALMLLFHAIAVLATGALIDSGRLWRPAAFLAVAGWIAGAVLFSGDIAMRAFAVGKIFPMAAPVGGSILIGAWLALAVSTLARPT